MKIISNLIIRLRDDSDAEVLSAARKLKDKYGVDFAELSKSPEFFSGAAEASDLEALSKSLKNAYNANQALGKQNAQLIKENLRLRKKADPIFRLQHMASSAREGIKNVFNSAVRNMPSLNTFDSYSQFWMRAHRTLGAVNFSTVVYSIVNVQLGRDGEGDMMASSDLTGFDLACSAAAAALLFSSWAVNGFYGGSRGEENGWGEGNRSPRAVMLAAAFLTASIYTFNYRLEQDLVDDIVYSDDVKELMSKNAVSLNLVDKYAIQFFDAYSKNSKSQAAKDSVEILNDKNFQLPDSFQNIAKRNKVPFLSWKYFNPASIHTNSRKIDYSFETNDNTNPYSKLGYIDLQDMRKKGQVVNSRVIRHKQRNLHRKAERYER